MVRLNRIAALAMFACSGPANAEVERWAREISLASVRFGVPKQWIRSVIAAESSGRALVGGRPVTSRAGAMGPMQLMPATWSEMREMLGLGPDPFRPRDNILAGTAYLRLMYDRFGYPGLFAAYNAGPQRYAAHIQSGRRLPRETLDYVASTSGKGAGLPDHRNPLRKRTIFFAISDHGASQEVHSRSSEPLFAVRISKGN